MSSHTTYEDFIYKVTLFHTSDDKEYDSKTVTAVNPHPTCAVSGTMTTELSYAQSTIDVFHIWNLVHSYTCSIETITADLYDETFLTGDVDTLEGKNSLGTAPEGLPELVYANFPI